MRRRVCVAERAAERAAESINFRLRHAFETTICVVLNVCEPRRRPARNYASFRAPRALEPLAAACRRTTRDRSPLPRRNDRRACCFHSDLDRGAPSARVPLANGALKQAKWRRPLIAFCTRPLKHARRADASISKRPRALANKNKHSERS